MERSYVKDLNEGEKVLLKGWIFEIRALAKLKFIVLRDMSGLVQCVVTDAKLFDKISDLSLESVVEITGKVKKANVKAELLRNDVEVEVLDIEILSKAENLPILVNEKTVTTELPNRLDYRWLDLRKPKNLLVFKIWTFMEKAMREWWDKKGFLQVYSPKFMPAPSESGAELFEVKYFGKKAYLAQSPQFYKQMAMAAGFEKIFEIGPVFRANPSHTSRHDTEFTMIDMEVSFIDSHEDVMKVEESWINYFISRVKEEFGEEIKKVFDVDVVVPQIPFPRVTMAEAQKLVRAKGYGGPNDDLDADGEKLLYESIKEKFGHEFVFVKDYPWSARPFYHMKHKDNPDLTKSFDLVWKGVEVTTGAQREHRLEILKKQATNKKINLQLIEQYLNFFKYGCPPHGGFAISPTRFLMLMLNLKNVREVTFLPRDTERLTP